MIGLSFDQWVLVIITIALIRLCFLVGDAVVFLAHMVEMMEEDEPEIYHPPYDIETGDV
jgi:hypothetical protein